MLTVYPRYSVKGLADYHGGDFKAKMWELVPGKNAVTSPFSRALLTPASPLFAPMALERVPLDPDGFHAVLDAQRKGPNKQVASKTTSRKRVRSLGLAFSAPKSVSVAALAGEQICPALVQAHTSAVDYVLANIGALLVKRVQNKLVPCPCLALQFAHPFSRLEDPQLHSHVELVWDFKGAEPGALHTFPLFYHQFFLRALYHFELVSRIQQAGYAVRIDNAQALRWELEGVAPAVCEVFSKRSGAVAKAAESLDFKSMGAAMRYGVLQTQRLFPKSLPDFSLSEARAKWHEEVGVEQCTLARSTPLSIAAYRVPGLEVAFRQSAVVTFQLLAARLLAASLGQTADGSEAMQRIQSALQDKVIQGTLLTTGKGAFCDPIQFANEERILKRVRAGIGKGQRCRIVGLTEGAAASIEAKAANRPDLVRVVAAGRSFPSGGRMELVEGHIVKGREPVCLQLPQWSAQRVLEALTTHGGRELLLLLQSQTHIGDFAAYLGRLASPTSEDSLAKGKVFRPWLRHRNCTVECRDGGFPVDPSRPWLAVENRLRLQRVHVLAPEDAHSPDWRRETNLAIARRFVLSTPLTEQGPLVEFDEVLSLAKLATEQDWAGTWLVSFRENCRMGVGERRRVLGFDGHGNILLKGARKRLNMPLSALRGLDGDISVVRPYNFRLVRGMALEAMQRLSSEGCNLGAGEVVYVAGWNDQGAIWLEEKRAPVPRRFRAFLPALILGGLKCLKHPPEVVITQDFPGSNILERLHDCRRSRRVILFSPDIKDTQRRLATAICERVAKAKAEATDSFIEGADLAEMQGSRDFWRPKIRLASLSDAIIAEAAADEMRRPKTQEVEDEENAKPSSPSHSDAPLFPIPRGPSTRDPKKSKSKAKKLPHEPSQTDLS